MNCVLAFDTALEGCSVGLWEPPDHLRAQVTVATLRDQAKILVPQIEAQLARAGRSYDDLGLIAVTRGPGSFTGVRVGLATAHALGLALDLPVAGVGTLECVAAQAIRAQQSEARTNGQTKGQKNGDTDKTGNRAGNRAGYRAGNKDKNEEKDAARFYLVLLETKRRDFYTALFDAAGRSVDEPVADTAEGILRRLAERPELEDSSMCLTLCGNAIARFQEEARLLQTPAVFANAGRIKACVVTLIDPGVIAAAGYDSWRAAGAGTSTGTGTGTGVAAGEDARSLLPRPQPLYLRGADTSQPKNPPPKTKVTF